MAALTQDQWYTKIKGLLPAWFFETESLQRAHEMALAKLLSTLQSDAAGHQAQTFITQAEDEFLDEHGYERQVDRLTLEEDEVYQLRIREFKDLLDLATIKAKVDACLNTAESVFVENWNYGFWDLDLYYNIEDSVYLDHRKTYNYFTIIIPVQLEDSADLMARVEVAANTKAYGVFADIYYQTGTAITDEDGAIITDEDGVIIVGA